MVGAVGKKHGDAAHAGARTRRGGHVSVNMSCPHHASSLLLPSVVEPGGPSREREAVSVR